MGPQNRALVLDRSQQGAKTVKALTIYQPWATLIALGVKPYEFRHWDYSTRYHRLQGARIAIHASARPVKHKEIADLADRMAQALSLSPRKHEGVRLSNGGTGLVPAALNILERIRAGMEGRGAEFSMPLSAIVCTATLGRAVRADTLFSGKTNDSDRDEHALFAWPMLDVTPTAPVPCRGLQGFWNISIGIENDLGTLSKASPRDAATLLK